MESDSRSPGVHAAIVRIPRTPSRSGALRRARVRSQHAGRRVSARGGRTIAPAVSAAERCAARACVGDAPAHLRGAVDATPQTAHADDPRRRGRARLVSGVPARQKREPSPRLARRAPEGLSVRGESWVCIRTRRSITTAETAVRKTPNSLLTTTSGQSRPSAGDARG